MAVKTVHTKKMKTSLLLIVTVINKRGRGPVKISTYPEDEHENFSHFLIETDWGDEILWNRDSFEIEHSNTNILDDSLGLDKDLFDEQDYEREEHPDDNPFI